jgi:hypothetical protein
MIITIEEALFVRAAAQKARHQAGLLLAPRESV